VPDTSSAVIGIVLLVLYVRNYTQSFSNFHNFRGGDHDTNI
jgi:hypothetical protein